MPAGSPQLLIFGCGYVGSAAASEALRRGWQVTALTRNVVKAEALRSSGIEVVVADLASTTWHDRISPAPDYMLNAVSSGAGGLAGYRRSYVEGMNSIASWASRRGAGTIVYTGSTSVYPQGDGAILVESVPTSGASERGQLLLEAENILRGETNAGWRRWFVLRLAGIYGPGRTHLVEQVRLGDVAGVPGSHLNLVHRDDIVAAIFACFTAPEPVANEIFNVADDGRATRGEITSWLAEQLGVAAPRFTHQPAGQRTAITPDRIISNAKIKAALGWRPRYPTFRDGYANLLSR